MANVRKIEVNTASVPKSAKIRVAAYCRVSTENVDQLESLETQKTHYESWITLHSNGSMQVCIMIPASVRHWQVYTVP